MKTLIASALLATAAFTATAQAMTAPQLVSEARAIVPGADFSDLTASDILAINNVIHGNGTQGEKQGFIRSLLN